MNLRKTMRLPKGIKWNIKNEFDIEIIDENTFIVKRKILDYKKNIIIIPQHFKSED
jgi:hypothetical protein